MSLGSKVRRALVFFILVPAFILIVSTPGQAQIPELRIQVVDSICGDPPKGLITVYMDNYLDTVAGFELWLMLDRPGVYSFETDSTTIYDTSFWSCVEVVEMVCIDSVAVGRDDPWDFFHVDTFTIADDIIDTSGTLISGWELVEGRSYTPDRIDFKIVAMADADPFDGVITPGVPAGQQGGVLFQLEGTVASVVDTVTEQCTSLRILTTPADVFVFANPQGELIGRAYRHFLDTSYFVCDQWDPQNPEVCLSWTQVPWPPYDSIHIEPDSTPYIDTMYVETSGDTIGTILLMGSEPCLPQPSCCGEYTGGMVGNANCSSDGKITLSDIVSLIDRVYVSKEPLCCEENGNASGDEEMKLTLADVADLIDHVFISRDPLPNCSGY